MPRPGDFFLGRRSRQVSRQHGCLCMTAGQVPITSNSMSLFEGGDIGTHVQAYAFDGHVIHAQIYC